ncbi:MAG: hypothetical protein D6689_15820 [Deltaproteobacteria bacterium]|nr:MAG: hypothetical protein D6689_15820 [Deltaproteobacteria bacterium]
MLRLATVGLLAALWLRTAAPSPPEVVYLAPAQVNASLAALIAADPAALTPELRAPLGLRADDVVVAVRRTGDGLWLDVVRHGRPLHVAIPIAGA